MKTRVISALVLFAIAAVMLLASEFTRLLFMYIASIIIVYEYTARLKEKGIHIVHWAIYGMLTAGFVLAITHCGPMTYIADFLICMCVSFFVAVVSQKISSTGALYTIGGLAYPGFIALVFFIVVTSEHWHQALLIGCFSVFVCDTFCLLGGKWFGKHKLCPAVSPKKTWEGSITGAVSSLILGVPVYFAAKLFAPLPLWFCFVACLLSSTAGQIGDLAESLIKRHLGVKDFSNLIPGHGGLFDRADSLFFSLPTAYFCLYCLNYFSK